MSLFYLLTHDKGLRVEINIYLSLSRCPIGNFKDRSDNNKAVLLTLPVQREAEVVALFHATVHHRHHDFLHARLCTLHCTTTHARPPQHTSPNEKAGFILIKPVIYDSNKQQE